ncbi:type I-U CRISPR-associated protein Csb2 [Nocardia sp. BMG111209]|uniref:type I-G CRISPR-associated protein Csb2 n=1 Tax=Nocardia sp. BMG111209 TaxID=1160137 RepID=UPI00036DD1A3|nr:type I-U CRISPR-associated protein Csb2 [Nocardia sp. BMG111209]
MSNRFGIRARFPLGVYTGHRSDLTPDPFPDPARLHAALLNAAGQGSTAVVEGTELRPNDAAVAALSWLERNPPTGIRLPRTLPVASRPVTAYRAEGVVRKEQGRWVDKKVQRAYSDGVAVDGAFGWSWDGVVVPPAVAEALAVLCADVSYLGEATSPVVLEVGEVEATEVLRRDLNAYQSGGHRVRAAVPGRGEALARAHLAARPAKSPSTAGDRHTTTDSPAPGPVPAEGLTELRYVPRVAEPPAAPWRHVLLIESDREVESENRLLWCVAMHQALIARIGYGAPPLITGKYENGVRPPVNRLAIQFLDRSVTAGHGLDSPAFGLMLPGDVAAEDLLTLGGALRDLTGLRSPYGRMRVSSTGRAIEATAFWPAPLPGHRRLWRTHPAVLPETQRKRRGDRPWSLVDAALLSVGFVWRGEFPGIDARNYRGLAEAVEAAGVKAFSPTLVTRETAKYAHKMPPGVPVQPYRATIDLGFLAGDRTIAAIGQTRHLGGGLLVPLDIPADAAALMFEENR